MEGASVIVDTGPLVDLLREMESRARNLHQLNREISLILVEKVDEEFETEGQGKWPPLSEETLKRRRKGDQGAKILQDTGRLAASIVPNSGPDFAEAFTNVKYAKYHVSKAPRKKIPLRDFFDVDLEAVAEEASEMVLEGIIG